MSTPDQVLESFRRGDLYHAESGLLVNRMPFLNVLVKTPWEQNHRISYQLSAAVRIGDAIIFPDNLEHDQVREMLIQANAIKVAYEHYQGVREMIISNCCDFGLACQFVDMAFCGRDLRLFAATLAEYGLTTPYGLEPEDFLRYINRQFANGVFAAAVKGNVPGRSRGWVGNLKERVDRLACGRYWTFFKDETEAMIFRLSDESGQAQFLKL